MIAGRYGEDTTRLRVLFAAMFLAFVFLGGALWKLQILNAHRYVGRQQNQSIRRVRLPGMRGRILDRSGRCLVKNRPSFCIAIYLEELRQPGGWGPTVDVVDGKIENMSRLLGLPRERSRRDILLHVKRRLPLPFLAWRDIPRSVVAKFEEHGRKFPGADIYVRPVRVYPEGKLAAHVLGYVGRADFSLDSDKAPDYYLPEMKGRKGLELQYNELLAGLPGAELIRVDASGFRRSVLEQKSKYPYPGEDVYTTLDARVQKLAEEIIAGRKGAAVVLDPRNGDVIAMASSPAFDPGVFSPAISEKDWQRFRGDEARPLLNRAVSGAYPPGSTFKPVVALTALENSDISANRTFNCPGYFALGGTRFRCWRRSGHGPLAMRKAIEQSCNAYFCQIGVKVGHRSIVHMARSLGFGAETGVELDYEVPGLVPDNAWKRRVYEDSWRPGDTCNISIGQGALLVTPLQMAVYTAALANGGKVYRPRLVREGGGRGDLENVMSWSDASLRVVRGGMHDVVNAGSGTGKRARIEAAEVAGKTGTAQYGPAGENKKHTWMIAFAPFDSPRYAAALIIEDGVSGGTTAAPRMGRLMKGIFELEAGGEPAGRLTWRDS